MPRGTPNLCRRFICRIVVPGTCPLPPPPAGPRCAASTRSTSRSTKVCRRLIWTTPPCLRCATNTKGPNECPRPIAQRGHISLGVIQWGGVGPTDPPLPAETHKAHTALISVLGAIRCNRLRYVLYCVTRSLCETDSTELLYHNVLRSQKVISKINSELSKYYFGREFFSGTKIELLILRFCLSARPL